MPDRLTMRRALFDGLRAHGTLHQPPDVNPPGYDGWQRLGLIVDQHLIPAIRSLKGDGFTTGDVVRRKTHYGGIDFQRAVVRSVFQRLSGETLVVVEIVGNHHNAIMVHRPDELEKIDD